MAIDKKQKKKKVVLIFIEELWHSWSSDAFRNTIFSTLSSYKSKLKNSQFILKIIKNVCYMQTPNHTCTHIALYLPSSEQLPSPSKGKTQICTSCVKSGHDKFEIFIIWVEYLKKKHLLKR